MQVVSSYPHAVREVENQWIELGDGCRLAARLWMPDDAEANPVPAILEYLPYRKRDSTRQRDNARHPYIAGHGYVCIRVDLRGTGDSDGVYHDEYLPQEQSDGAQVIDWISRQPWCDGNVGMIGISWGGFNGLQIAALQPPALKTIISVGSTDDRYASDVHYLGGCLTKDNIDWAAVMFSHNSVPPDPEIVGEQWRDMWLERLAANRPWAIQWLEHQRRDAYWQQGSVAEDLSRVKIPVYAVNGWADNYSEAIPRLLAGLEGPRKGLIGPWSHNYPQDGKPGPAIGFHQECLRWWDHWLKGVDTGIMDEPLYRVWMQDSVAPQTSYVQMPGRWVAEAEWPSPRIQWSRQALNPGRIDETAGPETPLTLNSLQTTGLTQGELGRYGEGGEFPSDQREDDGSSLVFISEPLDERLEIFGAPVVGLTLSSDRPVAFVAVRLNDVAPDGASTRVRHGVLNLTQRDDREHIAPLIPGERYTVRVELDDIAHSFAAGHRIAVSVSSTYWPMLWPSPEAVTLTIVAGASYLELPVRPPDPADDDLVPFHEPVAAPSGPVRILRPGKDNNRIIRRDARTSETVVSMPRDSGRSHLEDIDLEVDETGSVNYSIVEGDPLSARAWTDFSMERRRGDWHIRSETKICMSSTVDDFRLEAGLDAFEGDERIFHESWDITIPRDGL